MPDLSTAQWILVGALSVIQLVLFAAALTTVFRTPADRLTAPRVVWTLICLVQFIGPVIFFVAGRKPAPVNTQPATPAQQPTIDRVVTELYEDKQS